MLTMGLVALKFINKNSKSQKLFVNDKKDKCVAINQFVGGKHLNYFKIRSSPSPTSSNALNVSLCDISFIYLT